jgi:hypothetical protein
VGRRDYRVRSGCRGSPPNIGCILLARLSRMCSAAGGRRESKSPERGGGTPTAKLRLPFEHHGFMTNWGLGLVEGIIYYFILERRYETKKIRFNFRLLLPYVVPFMRALFEHNF